jgi:hypothetical protein
MGAMKAIMKAKAMKAMQVSMKKIAMKMAMKVMKSSPPNSKVIYQPGMKKADAKKRLSNFLKGGSVHKQTGVGKNKKDSEEKESGSDDESEEEDSSEEGTDDSDSDSESKPKAGKAKGAMKASKTKSTMKSMKKVKKKIVKDEETAHRDRNKMTQWAKNVKHGTIGDDILACFENADREGRKQLVENTIKRNDDGTYAVDLKNHVYSEMHKRWKQKTTAEVDRGVIWEEAVCRCGGSEARLEQGVKAGRIHAPLLSHPCTCIFLGGNM